MRGNEIEIRTDTESHLLQTAPQSRDRQHAHLSYSQNINDDNRDIGNRRNGQFIKLKTIRYSHLSRAFASTMQQHSTNQPKCGALRNLSQI